ITADGYQLQQINENNAPWQPVAVSAFTNNKTGWADSLDKAFDLLTTPVRNYTSQPYRKLFQPVNFHSWRPNYSDPEFSFTVYGNNILNTTETQVYYQYNENDKTHAVGGAVIYGGLFPYISMGSDYTFDRRSWVSGKLRRWNEWNSYVGLSLPLSWASNLTYKSLNIGTQYYYRSDFNKGINKADFNNLKFSYLSHTASWTERIQTTALDIYPQLGYNANLQFRHALNLYTSWQACAGINGYLPGLAGSHSLVLNGAIEY